MNDIQILSMNCRGLGDLRKRRDVVNYIRSLNFNIVFLQDTHMTPQTLPYFDSLWDGKCYHSCHSSHSRGTCIFIRKNTQNHIITEINSECGNYIILICRIHTEVFAFVNIYGPNRDQPTFFTKVFDHLKDIEVEHIVVAGDMNFIVDHETDCLNYVRENNMNAKRAFLQLADDFNLVDIWRYFNPITRKYTWNRRNPFKCGRLDMFFISEHLISNVENTDIIPGYRTDHNAITLSIKTKKQPRGNGLWMFNISHLQNEDYVNRIKTCITDTVKQYAIPIYRKEYYADFLNYPTVQLTISDCLFYETLLMLLRGESVSFAKQNAKQKKKVEKDLQQKLDKAQEQFNRTASESDLNVVELAKNELEEARKSKIEGLIVRSRVQWHEHGEKSSKYFLSLEKRNNNIKNIQYIVKGSRIISKTDTILKEFSDSLETKYKARSDIEVNKELISRNIATSITSSAKARLDKEMTLQELTDALHAMKKGKTPGSNGFPVEFFREFWSHLGPFLHRAFTASLKQNKNLNSHREGIIKLIPKQGKSLHELKGWRPITLLNVDYKIVSAAVTNRLKSVMSEIISPCQTAYISGRYIGENTRLLFDTLAFAKDHRIPGMIVAADFEAAFESISWEYLRSVMEQFNFGNNFLQIIDLLYLNRNNYSRIMLNGHLGPGIFLSRGIRQGDPASGYLFNMAVEVLAGMINQSRKLQGINISHEKQIRISQYADDTILLLDGSSGSVRGAMSELVKFANLSGLNVNLDKTSGLPIGTLATSVIPFDVGIKIVDEVKVLGIKLSTNLDKISETNFLDKLPAIRREIGQWKRRNLTPIGRICIIKALLLSKIVHLSMALPNPPDKILRELEAILFSFLWGGKGDKIKRTKIIQNYENDGLEMIDIKAFIDSMKLSWFKRLITSNADWIYIAHENLPKATDLLTYGKEKLTLIKNKTRNPFYMNVLEALIRFSSQYRPSSEQILSETIWFSDHTGFPKTIIREWDKKGLRFVCDLFSPSTNNLYSREDIKEHFGIRMTFLCYERLVRKLPKDVVTSTERKVDNPNIPFKIKAVMSKEKFTKHAYTTFVKSLRQKNANTDQRVRQKWESEVGGYNMGTMEDVMNATMSSSLLYLHYRIITRIYPTNKRLSYMNIAPSSLCTFCQLATETLAHMFWHCPKVKIFIKEVLSHIKQRFNTVVNINSTTWFFPRELSNINALIAIICKNVIHKARLDGFVPSQIAMMNALRTEASKEYYGCRLRNELDSFRNKWGELVKILE